MLYFTKAKENCTGCSACYAICPVQCITMVRDIKGFMYPTADMLKCIHCRKCEKVCPVIHDERGVVPISRQFAVAAVSKNQKVWEDSSSGGAFTEICKIFSDNSEAVVFGAEMQFPTVHHVGVDLQDIQRVRRSKYVQSEMGNCFIEAKDALEQGKRVIFVGTPCQVAGFRSYLDHDYKNLLCIDFICHGVGSPTVFEDCMRYEGEKAGSSVVDYKFRNKKSCLGNYQRHTSLLVYSNGRSRYIEMDAYNRLFLNQLCLRDCCGETCKFRKIQRSGDITIADFNNKEQVYPDLNDNRAYSTIIFNTEKGKELSEKLENNMIILPCDIQNIVRFNPLFCRSTPSNQKRKDFFDEYCKGKMIEELIECYVPSKKTPGYWRRFVPWKLKHKVYQSLVRMKRYMCIDE